MVNWPSCRGWRNTSSTSRSNSGGFGQKEDAMVCQAHLAGAGDGATTDQAGVRDGILGRAKRADGDRGDVGGEQTQIWFLICAAVSRCSARAAPSSELHAFKMAPASIL